LARELEEAYAEYNRRYFENQLPAVKVQWGKPGRDELANFRWTEAGGGDGVITISPRLKFSSRIWRWTLLHEMAHVRLCDHPSHKDVRHSRMHGRAFLSEMHRLVEAGAMDALF